MVSILICYLLLAYANIAVATKLITIPLFKESCDVRNKRSNDRISERAPNGNQPDPIRLVCEVHNPNYGIVKIGSDQLTVHGNSPVNSDGSRDFKVIFDTGSASTWVFGVPEPQKNDYKKSYYKSANLTSKPTIYGYRGAYSGGNLKTCGIYYMDNICIDNLCAFSQFVGVVSVYKCNRITHFEGVFGMGNFKDPSVPTRNIDKVKIGGYSVLEHVLMSNNVADSFALWFNRTGGILFLGRPDIRYYSKPLIYSPVISNKLQQWLILGSHFLINNRKVINMGEAVVDSGTDIIFGPAEEIFEIYEELDVDDYGYFKCDRIPTFPNIVVVLPHYRFVLKPEDYVVKGNIPLHDITDHKIKEWNRKNQKRYGNDRCHCGFGVANEWILGETFLRKVYTVFDVSNQRVGFATPKSV